MNYDEGLASIDWDSLEERNFVENKKSKNAGMAECLASSPVMPSDFQSIFVSSEKVKQTVEQLAKRVLGSCPFHVNVNENITQEGRI